MQELEKILEEIELAKKEPWYRLNDHVIKSRIDGAIERIMDVIRKHMNDVWIPVDVRPPEDNTDVLITYADVETGEQFIGITDYGYAYFGGKRLDYKEWRNPFRYFKEYYDVTAWMPTPKPYSPERSEE